MIKQTVTYVNFLGEEKTATYYFHITKAKVLTASDADYKSILELGKELEERAKVIERMEGTDIPEDPFDEQTIYVANTVRSMASLLEKVIDLSYGELSPDGEQFVQTEECLARFKNTAAYTHMMNEFLTNPNEVVTFIENVLKV